jgi:hypothetical protein
MRLKVKDKRELFLDQARQAPVAMEHVHDPREQGATQARSQLEWGQPVLASPPPAVCLGFHRNTYIMFRASTRCPVALWISNALFHGCDTSWP